MSMPVPTVTTETTSRAAQYDAVFQRIDALLDGEDDWIAAMATVVGELHHAFDYYHWTGFYRAVSDALLVVGLPAATAVLAPLLAGPIGSAMIDLSKALPTG